MKRALEATEMGRTTQVSIKDLIELSEEQRKVIETNINDKTLTLFSLPGGNICVPLIADDASKNTIPYTHVMNDKVLNWIKFWDTVFSWIWFLNYSLFKLLKSYP